MKLDLKKAIIESTAIEIPPEFSEKKRVRFISVLDKNGVKTRVEYE